MQMQTISILQIINNQSFKVNMTLYSPTNQRNETILYFHGGGLLYGSRLDLPHKYVKQFLDAGYHFLAIDYPLAPSSPLGTINQSVFLSINWFLNHYDSNLYLEKSSYILFGRSSGSYLVFKAASTLIEKKLSLPRAIINFYGYLGFNIPEFQIPHPLFHNSSNIEYQQIKKYLNDKLVMDDPGLTRFILYIYARQKGNWLDLLGITKDNIILFKVSENLLPFFPRTFHTASSMDNDVPFRINKKISQLIPNSKFYPVYNLPHDFDTNTQEPQAIKLYQELLSWLDD